MVFLPNTEPQPGPSEEPAGPATAGVSWLALPSKWGRGWLWMPAALWGRLVVLFGALALIKLALVVGLNKHLFEMHWRVRGETLGWANYLAFGGFVVMGVLSLAVLAQRCRETGVRTVRAANAAVLGLGLLFVFLTFHEGNRNYLYPIMDQVLGWKSLGPYLSLNLFFRPPFLGAWLFGYALAYYGLARTGREGWTLHLTTLCAGAYAGLHLRELILYRDELLVVDGLGLVCLASSYKSKRPLSVVWLLLPVVWTLCFWGLFRLASAELANLNPYLCLLVGESVVLFVAVSLLARKYGFWPAWSGLVLFYFWAFLLLASHYYPEAPNYNNLLCLALEFPRYWIGELGLVGGIGLGAAWYCRRWPQGRLWGLDLLSLVLIAIALVDLGLVHIMGVRLEWEVLQLADSPKMMWRMAKPYLPVALGGLAAIIVVYALALWAAQRWLCSGGERTAGGRRGFSFAAATAVLLGGLGWLVAPWDKGEGEAGLRLVRSSPLWQRAMTQTMNQEQFLSSAKALGLGDFRPVHTTAAGEPPRDLNVLVIFQESSYNQHLSLFGGEQETQPLLARYKERMELYPNFFSSYAGSIHARFATLTSLYPVRDFRKFTLQRVKVKSLFEVLHEQGYTCSLFDSCCLDYTGFRDLLKGRGLDEVYDADTMPGQRRSERGSWGLREEETMGAIRSQIQKYARSQQRFCLSYFPVAPHYPYDSIPDAFRKHKMVAMGDYTPSYLNALLYMDWVIASILDQLKESGLMDKTLVIITNDHGEMLGAKGGPIGHGWALTPELANTPLIIMDPAQPGYRLNYTVGSQVDLLPTLLDRLRIPIPSNQLYQGRSLDAPPDGAERLVYLNTQQAFGVLSGKQLILGDRQTENAVPAQSKRTVYTISNQGSKTVFTLEPGARPPAVAIRQFDEFQENLLAHYSRYCEMLCGGATGEGTSRAQTVAGGGNH